MKDISRGCPLLSPVRIDSNVIGDLFIKSNLFIRASILSGVFDVRRLRSRFCLSFFSCYSASRRFWHDLTQQPASQFTWPIWRCRRAVDWATRSRRAWGWRTYLRRRTHIRHRCPYSKSLPIPNPDMCLDVVIVWLWSFLWHWEPNKTESLQKRRFFARNNPCSKKSGPK